MYPEPETCFKLRLTAAQLAMIVRSLEFVAYANGETQRVAPNTIDEWQLADELRKLLPFNIS